ncbi:hypothetical protein [Photorhabdus australis]
MLPGIRSLAVAMHLEIYWVYTYAHKTKKYQLSAQQYPKKS